MKKLVLFGAGKIGRSFIGQLFGRSGYEVVFIDNNERVIFELNLKKKYRIVIKSDDSDEVIWVENVRGILAANVDEIASEISQADIMAISVGQNSIRSIAPTIAKGIQLRHKKNPDYPLDIILAENLRDAAKVMGSEIEKYISTPIDLDKYLGLIETSIGKMVPIMPNEIIEQNPLLVYAEPYNTLILDQLSFKNSIPNVVGLAPKKNMSAWVDRKFFIHNLGHAAAAYYGYVYYPELTYISEIMSKKDVYEYTKSTMSQSADILRKVYPDEFTEKDFLDHIEDLIYRFSNHALRDTVYRIGQDLYRKLGPEDRVVVAIKMGIKYSLPYDKILKIVGFAMRFKATDEQGLRSASDVKFCQEAEKGTSYILEEVCGLSESEYPEVHILANRSEH